MAKYSVTWNPAFDDMPRNFVSKRWNSLAVSLVLTFRLCPADKHRVEFAERGKTTAPAHSLRAIVVGIAYARLIVVEQINENSHHLAILIDIVKQFSVY